MLFLVCGQQSSQSGAGSPSLAPSAAAGARRCRGTGILTWLPPSWAPAPAGIPKSRKAQPCRQLFAASQQFPEAPAVLGCAGLGQKPLAAWGQEGQGGRGEALGKISLHELFLFRINCLVDAYSGGWRGKKGALPAPLPVHLRVNTECGEMILGVRMERVWCLGGPARRTWWILWARSHSWSSVPVRVFLGFFCTVWGRRRFEGQTCHGVGTAPLSLAPGCLGSHLKNKRAEILHYFNEFVEK